MRVYVCMYVQGAAVSKGITVDGLTLTEEKGCYKRLGLMDMCMFR